MRTSNPGLDIIKKHEGLRLTAYLCPAGYPTIGYGHRLLEGEDFEIVTEKEANALLRKDVEKAERAVSRFVDVPLNQGQFDALVSFTFNLGSGNLKASTLLKKLNAGDYKGAAEEFPRWVHAGGKKLAGLVARRAKERQLFLS